LKPPTIRAPLLPAARATTSSPAADLPRSCLPCPGLEGLETILREEAKSAPSPDALAHLRLNPLFPALRSGPNAVSLAARQKQIPSNQRQPAAQFHPKPKEYMPFFDLTRIYAHRSVGQWNVRFHPLCGTTWAKRWSFSGDRGRWVRPLWRWDFWGTLNPLFPALRSNPNAVSTARRQKQIPSSSSSTPFSPPSGPIQTLFQRLAAKSKFLAAKFLAANATVCSTAMGKSSERTHQHNWNGIPSGVRCGPRKTE
jgi:hypothetical protein